MELTRWNTKRQPRSLHWDGDELVDWVSGGTRWRADGAQIDRPVRYAYPFDRAVVSPSGRFQVLYTECGTKGLVLEAGRVLREINRSYYHADDYKYPITLGRLPDGREVLVHCPENYNRLEVDELASGRRLTEREGRSPDLFHSRLSLSPDGRRLLSGGWVWHPVTVAEVYDLSHVLDDPGVLDRRDDALWRAINTEVVASCWLTDDLLVVATAVGEEPFDDEDDSGLGAGELGVWSVSAGRWHYRSTVDYRGGLLLPCGDAVLVLCEHPKLIDPTSGQILAEWPDLSSGQREFPYFPKPVPPIAVHPDGTRFAIASGDTITVATLAAA